MALSKFTVGVGYDGKEIRAILAELRYDLGDWGLLESADPSQPIVVMPAEDNGAGFGNTIDDVRRRFTMQVDSNRGTLNERLTASRDGQVVLAFYRRRGTQKFTFLGPARLQSTAAAFYTFSF